MSLVIAAPDAAEKFGGGRPEDHAVPFRASLAGEHRIISKAAAELEGHNLYHKRSQAAGVQREVSTE